LGFGVLGLGFQFSVFLFLVSGSKIYDLISQDLNLLVKGLEFK
jgi:hypothetical protein